MLILLDVPDTAVHMTASGETGYGEKFAVVYPREALEGFHGESADETVYRIVSGMHEALKDE